MFPNKQRSGTYKRCLILMLALVLCMLPAMSSQAADGYGVVKAGSLNLRAAPSMDAAILGSYPSGTWVQVLEVGSAWHKVKVDGRVGYMSTKYVSLDNVTSTTDAQVYGAAGYINLRQEPAMGASVLGRYNNGTRVKILSHQNGWYFVQVGSQTGYMVDYLVRMDNQVVTTYAIVRTKNGGNLNMRQAPSTDGAILTSVANGTQVKVIKKGGDWTQAQHGALTGYMATQYLSFGGKPAPAPAPATKWGTVNNPKSTQVLNLREIASLDARVLASFGNGTRVEILGATGDFYKVRVAGMTGYMMKAFIKADGSKPAPKPVPVTPFVATLFNPNGNAIVNFRAAASLNAQIICAYAVGTQVTVLELGQDWSLVKIGEACGYVSSYFLRY